MDNAKVKNEVNGEENGATANRSSKVDEAFGSKEIELVFAQGVFIGVTRADIQQYGQLVTTLSQQVKMFQGNKPQKKMIQENLKMAEGALHFAIVHAAEAQIKHDSKLRWPDPFAQKSLKDTQSKPFDDGRHALSTWELLKKMPPLAGAREGTFEQLLQMGFKAEDIACHLFEK